MTLAVPWALNSDPGEGENELNAKSFKILAFDREQLLLCALERACKGRALDIRTAATTEQALAEIDDCHFDLFLLDFNLKDPGCRHLLEMIDQRCPYVPVILMTTWDKTSGDLVEAVRACRKQGAWHLLEKPFSLDRMIHYLEGIYQGLDKGDVFFNPLTHNYEYENRRHLRRSHVKPVNFAYSCILDGRTKDFASRGILTDLCDGGSGMLTHDPLQPGQVIRFFGDFTNKLGTVVWSAMIEEKETYRCGVQFC